MHTVSITELKAKLSHYLRIVRRGGEVQILDRGVPVARLVSVRGEERSERWERLVKAGVLRAGTGDASAILDEPLLALAEADLSGALDQEREDRL